MSGNLRIANNASDELILSANGAFTFNSKINSGSSYAVTVKADPVGQRCTVTSGNGIAVNHVTSIMVSCISFPRMSVFAGMVGDEINTDGIGDRATFGITKGMASDAQGNLYVINAGRSIRKITPAGEVSTLFTEESATLEDVAIDSKGNLFVTTSFRKHAILKIDTSGAVTTFAGGSESGKDNGLGQAARFNNPIGIAIDASDNLYVADSMNDLIRKVTPAGNVSTFAGGDLIFVGASPINGRVDAVGTNARFYGPMGITLDKNGNIFVADSSNDAIRKITPAGVVTTVAGGSQGSSDGVGSSAKFDIPVDITVDTNGNLYVSDFMNHSIRKITPSGQVTTLAGGGGSGLTNGTGSAAKFFAPIGIAFVNGNLYISDSNNQKIRKLELTGKVTDFVGGAAKGAANGLGTVARFNNPQGLTVDDSGNLFVADYGNEVIRMVTPSGVVSNFRTGIRARDFVFDSSRDTYSVNDSNVVLKNGVPFAGSSSTAGIVNGAIGAARFNTVRGITIDSLNNFYVADNGNKTIRKIASNEVTSVSSASMNPSKVVADAQGNLYVTSESFPAGIIKIGADGTVGTLAGSNISGFQDGTGSNARFRSPGWIAIDRLTGNLYVTDVDTSSKTYAIRKVTPQGDVTTVIGQSGESPDFTPGLLPGKIYEPKGIAIYGDVLYFVQNHGVVKVTPLP